MRKGPRASDKSVWAFTQEFKLQIYLYISTSRRDNELSAPEVKIIQKFINVRHLMWYLLVVVDFRRLRVWIWRRKSFPYMI